MKPEQIKSLTSEFESYVNNIDGVECWFARDLIKLLGYNEWRNFIHVINKAKIACENAKHTVEDHFVDVNKLIEAGKGAKREIEDILLTRYACYLTAQNGDPRKEEIAFAQTYFAQQTRRFEILKEKFDRIERVKARKKLTGSELELSRETYGRGFEERDFAVLRSKGDEALFGGYTTSEMKRKLEIPANRPLADFLPTISIKAKDFANEITIFKVKEDENLLGVVPISRIHVLNNKEVRDLLIRRGIRPEQLPAEEDVKKVERRLKSENKKSLQKPNSFKELRDSEAE